MERSHDRSPDLGQLLLGRFRWIEARLEAELEGGGASDLTVTQVMLVASIPPGGARQVDIARGLGVSRQAVHELVAGLEREGIVERVSDSSSGSAKLVRLTERGRSTAGAAQAAADRLESGLRRRIGNLSVDVLREVLEADWGS